jgi:small-conductance mechanosensitive channel
MIKRYLVIIFCIYVGNGILLCADVDSIIAKIGIQTPFFGLQKKDEQLEKITKKIQEFPENLGQKNQRLAADGNAVKEKIQKLELQVRDGQENEHILDQLAILREIDQVLKDKAQTYDDINIIMHDYKKILERVSQDPNHEYFKKEYKLHKKNQFSFHDLLALYQGIQSLENRLVQLGDQKKNVEIELESHRAAAKAEKKSHQGITDQLEKIQEMLARKEDEKLHKDEEILQLQLQLAEYKEQREKLKGEYFDYRSLITAQQLATTRTQLQMLKQHVQNIKYNIHVSERDLSEAQEKLNTEKAKNFSKKDALRVEREELLKEKSVHEQMLEQTSKSYKMEPILPEDWARDIDETVISYRRFVEIGWLSSHVRSLDIHRQFIEASLTLLDVTLENKQTLLAVMEAFNRLLGRKFVGEGKFLEDKKRYDELIDSAKVKINLYTEKIETITKELNRRKKIHDLLNNFDQKIMQHKDTLFKEQGPLFEEVQYFIRMAIKEEKKYTETLSKLSESYTAIISELENIMRLSSFILTELRSGTIWHRPAYAITWQGITNAFPELMDFMNDVVIYLRYTGFGYFWKKISSETHSVWLLFLFLLKVFFILFLVFVYQRVSFAFCAYLFERSNYTTPGIRKLLLCIAVFLKIIERHRYSISIGILCFLLATLLSDVYVFTVFYLLLIPYSIYFVWNAMKLVTFYNNTYDYFLIPLELSEQFVRVATFLLGTTISIMLIRQAFLLSGFSPDSELPTILLALNFIILQLSLISLISKEHITELLPEGTPFWQEIRTLIDTYFYFILLAISTVIVLSNPYIGFGRLVLYVLVRIFYVTLIVRLALFVHGLVKTGFSHILFTQEAGMVKERFEYAKTMFGVVLITSFLLLAFVSGVVIAKVFGWPIVLKNVFALLYEPLFYVGTNNPISPFSILQIIGFVIIGFLFSSALEHFVFVKIFDLLLIEVGIQHTIVRITQYIVIIIALFIGFQNVGLGQIIGYAFTALALSVGWYIKEPISDFFAYFIILVQRTIKIGDFIRLDNDIEGVVRKITPRSVMIRRKNSTTLVIPNSIIVQRVVANWNYIRSFIAFDDMRITIQYHEDPAEVRNILIQVLNNHPRILKTPKPIVFLDNFGDHGYVFLIRGFISSTYTLDMWEIASEVRLQIIQALRENNIQVAIPVRFIAESPLVLQKNGSVVRDTTISDQEEKKHF